MSVTMTTLRAHHEHGMNSGAEPGNSDLLLSQQASVRSTLMSAAPSCRKVEQAYETFATAAETSPLNVMLTQALAAT